MINTAEILSYLTANLGIEVGNLPWTQAKRIVEKHLQAAKREIIGEAWKHNQTQQTYRESCLVNKICEKGICSPITCSSYQYIGETK